MGRMPQPLGVYTWTTPRTPPSTTRRPGPDDHATGDARAGRRARGASRGCGTRPRAADRSAGARGRRLTAVVVLPLLVALVALRTPRWYPLLDLAMTELRVRDVGTATAR